MKKRILGVMATVTVLSVVLSACGKNAGGSKEEPLDGGWSNYNDIETAVLTDESKEAFDTAMASYDGDELEPAALLATQIVAGKNYAYLAKAKDKADWYVVVVYQDLQGNASVTSANEINTGNPMTTEPAPKEHIVGGWAIEPSGDLNTLPTEIQDAFKSAAEEYEDVFLTPLAILETQVVAGMNYTILCHGVTSGDDPVEAIYFATFYVDPQQKGRITDAKMMDFLSYLGQ